MPDIEILDQMIRNDVKVALTENYGKKMVVLTEHQQPDSIVTIAGMPDNAIVIKADVFKSPDTVFTGSHGECKRADFVIVANNGNKKTIVCIEMKARTNSEKEIIQQLMGARCFITYCQEIGKEFWKQEDFLDEYVFRFVSISRTCIAKSKTRVNRDSVVHDKPDRMLKISSPHRLEFNHLAGKV